MILTINSDFLRNAASLCRRIKIKGSLAILEHVRITVPPGKIEATVEYTDLDIHIATHIPLAGPTSPGCFTIGLDALSKLLAGTDKGSVMRFEADAGEGEYPVTVTYMSKKLQTVSTFTGLDPEQMPPAPDAEGTRAVFPSDTVAAIRHLLPITSDDQTRYVLNGVFITPDRGGAIVATDGRRLAITRARIPCMQCILPAKLVALLDHPLLTSAAVATVDPASSKISFAFGKTDVHSRIIEGNFPGYQQVIPPDRNFSATITEAVANSLVPWLRQQAARLAQTKSNSILLTLGKNTITLSARDKNSPAVSTAIPAYILDGPEKFAISFNPAFLADGLALGLRTIDFIDEMSPGVLTNGTTRYVLMPMRVIDGPPQGGADNKSATDPEEADADAEEDATEDAIDMALSDANTIEVEATVEEPEAAPA